MDQFSYQGEELSLFEEARNWKRYFSSLIIVHIKGDVLEVGAGIGETSPYLFNTRVSSWTCLEPDAGYCQVIQKKLESFPAPSEVIQGTLDALKDDSRFDTILYIDVLEHIIHDKEEIRQAAGKLKPGGHIIILSPAYQFLYSAFDTAIGHHRRYTKKSLRELMEIKQLKESRIFYLESTGMILLLLNRFLFRKKYPTLRVIRTWDKVFIPISKITDKLLFHSSGKTIIGIWQYKGDNE